MTPFLGFPFGRGGAGVSGASASGAGVSGAGVSGADASGAGSSVADGVTSGLILLANSRMVKRRHLTSLQAESQGLLGTSSSIEWIRLQAFSLITSKISFQCSSGIVGIGLDWLAGRG